MFCAESSNADRATAMPANGVNAPAHSDIPSGMNSKAPKPKPAEMDALNFKLHPSVEYWRNFESNFQSLFTGEYVFSDTQGYARRVWWMGVTCMPLPCKPITVVAANE